MLAPHVIDQRKTPLTAAAPDSVLARQLLSFAVVGTIGFFVDSAVLYAGLYAGLGPYLGRLLSYLVAVTTTWALNRRYTFGHAGRGLWSQWARFTVSQLAGAAVNLGSYGLLVRFVSEVARYPIIGVGVGSIAGLLVNFSVARRYVFSARTSPDAPACPSPGNRTD
jgi:putative flippase GtrA